MHRNGHDKKHVPKTVEERVKAGMNWFYCNAPLIWWSHFFQPSNDGKNVNFRLNMRESGNGNGVLALAFESESAFTSPKQGFVTSEMVEKAYNINNTKALALGFEYRGDECDKLEAAWKYAILKQIDLHRLPYQHRKPDLLYELKTHRGVTIHKPGAPEGPRQAAERLRRQHCKRH